MFFLFNREKNVRKIPNLVGESERKCGSEVWFFAGRLMTIIIKFCHKTNGQTSIFKCLSPAQYHSIIRDNPNTHTTFALYFKTCGNNLKINLFLKHFCLHLAFLWTTKSIIHNFSFWIFWNKHRPLRGRWLR